VEKQVHVSRLAGNGGRGRPPIHEEFGADELVLDSNLQRQEKSPKVTAKVTHTAHRSHTRCRFSDIVTKCLKTGNFAQSATNQPLTVLTGVRQGKLVSS
jgi:hypothetical protein